MIVSAFVLGWAVVRFLHVFVYFSAPSISGVRGIKEVRLFGWFFDAFMWVGFRNIGFVGIYYARRRAGYDDSWRGWCCDG